MRDIIKVVILVFYLIVCSIAIFSRELCENCLGVIKYLNPLVIIILTGIVGNTIISNTANKIAGYKSETKNLKKEEF